MRIIRAEIEHLVEHKSDRHQGTKTPRSGPTSERSTTPEVSTYKFYSSTVLQYALDD